MRTAGPVPQALTLPGFKQARGIHAEDTDRDAALALYLGAAQDTVERACRRPMGPRDVTFTINASGWCRWWFPVCPVQSVDRVAWVDADGNVTTIPAGWRIARPHDEPQLVLNAAARAGIPDDATFEVDAQVGLMLAEVPRNLTTALILLAGEWLDAGIAIGTESMAPMSFGARRILEQMRYSRPQEWA